MLNDVQQEMPSAKSTFANQTNKVDHKLNTDVSQQNSVEFLRAMMSIPSMVAGYYLDLNEGTYHAVEQEEKRHNRYRAEGKWDVIDDLISNFIHPDDREALTKVTRIDFIRESVKKNQQYSIAIRDISVGTERWLRYSIMKCSDEDHAAIVLRDISDVVQREQELAELNAQLQENQIQLEESAAEQESQLEEITSLNEQLEDNQAELEASVAEQEAQLEEITKLNGNLAEYSGAMSRAGYGMWHIILKDGVAPRMKVNDKMAELLGVAGQQLTEEEMYNAWYGQIVPEAIPSVQASVGEMLAGQFSENTYQWTHPTKGVIYVRCGGTAEKLPDGTSVLSGYHTDVTNIVYHEMQHTKELEEARKKAEEEQNKVSEAYGMIKGLSQEYHTIWVVSKETSKMRLIRSSGVSTIQNAVQMGIDLPAFDSGFDKYINTYIEPEDRARMKKEIAFAEILRQLDKNGFYAVNYLRRDDSGHVGYHQVAFADADTQDGKKQFVYGFRDIDKIVKEEEAKKEELLKAREAAESANKAKTSFLFNMSHDIRTPMNAIIGYTDLIEKHYDDKEKCMDYLKKTKQANQFLLSLINNILEMARIESGKAKLDFSVCPVGSISREVASIFEEQMKNKGITYEVNVETHTEQVFCDQARVREIYLNLLSNALKYTHEGGKVTMDVKELPSDQPGYICLQAIVKDTGIGMSKEFLPHLFEEFTREHTATESRQQGTGLGMPIVKKILDMMGGTIDVESEPGKGTTFTVTYPLRVAKAAHVGNAEVKDTDQMYLRGKHILLAEDNDMNAEIATEILTEAGFRVDRAEDGIVCVHMLEEAADGFYDLILMDVQMPNMDGYKATQAIRHIPDAMKAGIPIIAMTANAFEEDKKEALEAGMNGHIAKPIDVRKLIKTINEVFKAGSVNEQSDHSNGDTNFNPQESTIYLELKRSMATMVAPGGFFAYRAEQPEKLLFANELACKLWGCNSFEELYDFAGGSFRGLVHPEDYEKVEKEIWHQIDNGGTGLDQVKYHIVAKDGTIKYIDDYGRLEKDEDKGDIFYVFVSEAQKD